jgi:hypothetical protein
MKKRQVSRLTYDSKKKKQTKKTNREKKEFMYIFNNNQMHQRGMWKNSRQESNFHILGRGGTVEYVIRSAKERDPTEYVYMEKPLKVVGMARKKKEEPR